MHKILDVLRIAFIATKLSPEGKKGGPTLLEQRAHIGAPVRNRMEYTKGLPLTKGFNIHMKTDLFCPAVGSHGRVVNMEVTE